MIHTDGRQTVANAPRHERRIARDIEQAIPRRASISGARITPAERRAMSRSLARRIVREYR